MDEISAEAYGMGRSMGDEHISPFQGSPSSWHRFTQACGLGSAISPLWGSTLMSQVSYYRNLDKPAMVTAGLIENDKIE
jgi:hypothetical protein